MSDDIATEVNASSETSSAQEKPVQMVSAQRSAARTAAARQAFREALKSGGAAPAGDDGDDDAPSVVEPTRREPVEAAPAAEPEPEGPEIDLDGIRLRRQLAAQQHAPEAPSVSYEDLIDRPGPMLRSWIEDLRGEKFGSDDDFKAETADLVSRLASEVLGVPLPSHVRAKLDAAAARKGLRAMQSSAAKREAKARERAERDAVEREWNDAAEALDRRFAAEGSEAARAYSWLAAEDNPGQIVIDVIRAAAEDGERVTWEAAAKMADQHLKSRHSKRAARVNPPKPATPPRTESKPAPAKPWTRAGARSEALAAFRKATAGKQ